MRRAQEAPSVALRAPPPPQDGGGLITADGSSPALRGRGTVRSMVEGACRHLRTWRRIAGLLVCCMLWTAAAAADMTSQPIAVLQGLDKITARVSRFEAKVGETVGFGTLSITVRDCQRSAPEDDPESAVFLEISETKPGEQKQKLFSGWMFASSPALSALEHPVYDVTLLECKGAAPPPPPPAANSSTTPAPKTRGKTAR